MKTHKLILLLCIFFSKISFGQNNWEFYHQLSVEANKDSIGICDTIDRFSLNKQLFEKNMARMAIDTLANYQILFEYNYSWSNVVGNDWQEKLKLNDSIHPTITLPHTTDPICTYKNARIYTGSNLFRGLDLDSSYLTPLEPLQSFPLIHERNDLLNGTWEAISSGDYLILRYVHSYPDGNVTSFYDEFMLYFRKVK